MKAVYLIVLFTFALSSHIVNKNFVEHLKKIAPFEVFEAEENPFRDWTDEEIKNMLSPKEKTTNLKRKDIPQKINENDIPEHYDFRQEHPDCILPVKNQGQCAAGYAFGAATSLQQRYCFENQDKVNPDLSPQRAISCYTEGKACQGRTIYDIIFDLDYLVTEDCWPYSSSSGTVEGCRTTCSTGKEWKKWARESYGSIYGGEESIKFHIFTNGPVISVFDVYSDFINYRTGIYEHVSGDLQGTHSTSLIGYGKEGDTPYYIGQNSWGSDWGESGYFRIKTTVCNISEKAYSLYPAYPPS